MKNKYTKEEIEGLIAKFLEAKTTEAEEQTLADFFCHAEEVPQEWAIYKEMFQSFKTHAYDFGEEEIDAMLIPAQERKPRNVRMWTWISVSVACVAASLVWVVMQPWNESTTSELPRVAQAKTQDVALAKDSVGSKMVETSKEVKGEELFADKIALKGKSQRSKEHKERKRKASSQKDISTTELLETMNVLADIGAENVTLTTSPHDDCFVVKAVDNSGQANSYTLRKGTDGSTLELVSQLTNF